MTTMSGAEGLPQQVAMILLGVEELERSVVFYRDLMGLPFQGQGGGFARFGTGAVTLLLSEDLGRVVKPIAGATEVVFAVASVARSFEVLRQRGCPFLNEAREVTPGSWAASFVDPDGHRLTLFGPK